MSAEIPTAEELRAQARSVQAIIREIAGAGPLVVGFPSPPLMPDAYAALRRLRLRKPFLATRQEWTRRAIVYEPRAYEYLWPHVALEFLVDGSLRSFSGLGSPRGRNSALASIETRLPPIYWDIRLEQHYEQFVAVFASWNA